MKDSDRKCCLAIALFFVLLCSAATVQSASATGRAASAAQDRRDGGGNFQTLYAVTHLHSSYSYTGSEPLDEIAKKVHDKKIDVFIPTDTFVATWDYGLWPLRGLIHKQVVKPSVLSIGIQFYLDRLKEIERRYPDMIVIPGVEAAPYYRWEGSPWRKLILVDWHRHILVIGLERLKDYKNLPVLGNPGAFPLSLGSLLAPIAVLVLACLAGFRGLRFALGILGIFGVLLFCNNWPFRRVTENPYDRTTSWAPYQRVIDYAAGRGGLVFWAHPDAPNWTMPKDEGSVAIQTSPYPEALLKTKNHQGFAIFAEGNRSASLAGGEWDQGLMQYCRGERAQPFWGSTELDYRKAEPAFDVDSTQIVLQARERTPAAVLEALRAGRFYVILLAPYKNARMLLENWVLKSNGQTANAGETLKGTKAPWVELSVGTDDGKPRPAQVEIIRGGVVIVQERVALPHHWAFYDLANRSDRTYYRVHIRDGDTSELYTNPIFSFAP